MNLLIKPPQSAITAIAKAARHNSNPAGHSKTFRQPQSSSCLFLCVSVTVNYQKNQTQKERNRKAAQHRERERARDQKKPNIVLHAFACISLSLHVHKCHWSPPLKTLTLTNLSNNKSSNNHFLSTTSDKPILKVVNSN